MFKTTTATTSTTTLLESPVLEEKTQNRATKDELETSGDINLVRGDRYSRVKDVTCLDGKLEKSKRKTTSHTGSKLRDSEAARHLDKSKLDSNSSLIADHSTRGQQVVNRSNNSNNNEKIAEFGRDSAAGSFEESDEVQLEDQQETDEGKREKEFKAELVWLNIFLFVILHSCFPIGLYMLISQRPWKTLAFSILGMYASGLGVTGGSHRLWSHRSYKAKWPVQMILVILQTMAGQNSIYTWSRDHRVHHKFSETDADPHNIKRGFFFAHMGWLCCKKHPDVKEKGKLIDMSDLEANPYVMFQHRNFWWMSALFTVLVPTMIPVLLWNERFWTSFVFSFMVRYLITLHGTWLVNSAAHYYGSRPYDVKIEARESPYVIYNALGEGFHNYHHTFPFDYATSEFGRYLNITTTFIDLCASLGLVYERRKVDPESILRRRARTGDLTCDSSIQVKEQKTAATTQSVVRRLLRSSSNSNKSTIDETDEPLNIDEQRANRSPLNNIIHELPYISGLMSMKYTM